MEKLYKAVEIEIGNELQRASDKFGDKNNSPHEAYAVIKEEYEEALEEVCGVSDELKAYWQEVKKDNRQEQNRALEDLKTRAHLVACEMIQVAAMAQKALNGYMREERKNDSAMEYIRKLSKEEMTKVIETREPRGLFYGEEGGLFIGIDNTTGDAWTEEFKDLNDCVKWLEREEDEEDGQDKD